MNYSDFGRALLESGDLDPLYIVIADSNLAKDPTFLKRWIFGYWCFYHAGVASRLAESDDYWDTFARAVRTAPRGRERRHFRAGAAQGALTYFQSRYDGPEQAVDGLLGGQRSWAALSKHVQTFPQFGPWMTFKVADMAERVMGVEVDFSGCELSLYAEPVKGAEIIAREYLGRPDFDARKDMHWLVGEMLNEFGEIGAPPDRNGRKVNIQEVETILCKFKGHHFGRYPVGHDTQGLIADLERMDSHLYTVARGIFG